MISFSESGTMTSEPSSVTKRLRWPRLGERGAASATMRFGKRTSRAQAAAAEAIDYALEATTTPHQVDQFNAALYQYLGLAKVHEESGISLA